MGGYGGKYGRIWRKGGYGGYGRIWWIWADMADMVDMADMKIWSPRQLSTQPVRADMKTDHSVLQLPGGYEKQSFKTANSRKSDMGENRD